MHGGPKYDLKSSKIQNLTRGLPVRTDLPVHLKKKRIRETKDDVILEYDQKMEKNDSRRRLLHVLVSYTKRDNL